MADPFSTPSINAVMIVPVIKLAVPTNTWGGVVLVLGCRLLSAVKFNTPEPPSTMVEYIGRRRSN